MPIKNSPSKSASNLLFQLKEIFNRYELRTPEKANNIAAIYLALALVGIWFLTPIQNFYNQFIVNGLLNFPKTPTECAITILLIVFGLHRIVIATIHIYRAKYYLSLTYILLLFAAFGIFFYYRYLETQQYDFYPVTSSGVFKSIKFLDLIVFPATVPVCMLFLYSLVKSKPKEKHFKNIIADNPLDNLESDEYNRRKFYQSLLDHICQNEMSKISSITVGLINQWGEGKTSFLAFLKDQLSRYEDTIVVEFNAWNVGKKNLTLQFFQTFDYELSKYLYTGSLIRRYAHNLTRIESVFNITKYLPNEWISETASDEYIMKINRLIFKSGKRIIVLIDDIDRLNNKEIMDVLQMIRISASFSNTMFVVPFDKKYILNSLISSKIHNPREYLKKIFNVEFTLPVITEKYLARILLDYLEREFEKALDGIPSDHYKDLLGQLNNIVFDARTPSFFNRTNKYGETNSVLFSILRNKRDILRFTNSLMFQLKHLYNKVYFPDLFILELIKLIDEDIHKRILSRDKGINESGSDVKRTFKIDLCGKKDETEKKKSECFSLRSAKEEYTSVLNILLKVLFQEPSEKDYNHSNSIYYVQNFFNYIEHENNTITNEVIDKLFDDE